MADMPRWEHHTVYSPAMFMAFKSYHEGLQAQGRLEEYEQLQQLYIVRHRYKDDDGVRAASYSTGHGQAERPCREKECGRCRSGRGGWAFRWHSPLWYDIYARMPEMRGSWTLPRRHCDSEAAGVVVSQGDFTDQP